MRSPWHASCMTLHCHLGTLGCHRRLECSAIGCKITGLVCCVHSKVRITKLGWLFVNRAPIRVRHCDVRRDMLIRSSGICSGRCNQDASEVRRFLECLIWEIACQYPETQVRVCGEHARVPALEPGVMVGKVRIVRRCLTCCAVDGPNSKP